MNVEADHIHVDLTSRPGRFSREHSGWIWKRRRIVKPLRNVAASAATTFHPLAGSIGSTPASFSNGISTSIPGPRYLVASAPKIRCVRSEDYPPSVPGPTDGQGTRGKNQHCERGRGAATLVEWGLA